MSPKTILVIEDNPLNMKLVRSILARGNYSVLEAADAETGMLLAREKQPDAILMDIQLPGIDGLSATRILKSDPRCKNTIIIAITSYAMENDDKKAYDAGCDGYITKPIDIHSFLETMEQYLNSTH
jgi:CheY-like chemotaxis protein